MFNSVWFGWLATICFGVCYWPQLYKTFKRKTVEDMSIWQWWLQMAGYCVGIRYGMALKQNALIFGYLHGGICTFIFLLMFYHYRGK